MTPDNVIVTYCGYRRCRKCKNEYERLRRKDEKERLKAHSTTKPKIHSHRWFFSMDYQHNVCGICKKHEVWDDVSPKLYPPTKCPICHPNLRI